MGIEIYDKDRTYRVKRRPDGPAPGAGGKGGPSTGGADGGGRYGSAGHDYRRDDDGSASIDQALRSLCTLYVTYMLLVYYQLQCSDDGPARLIHILSR